MGDGVTSQLAGFWRNVAGVMTGTAVAQAIPLFGTLVLARLYEPADFGSFAVWLSIVFVLAVVLTARFESSLAVVADGEERDQAVFVTLSTVTLLTLISTVLLAVIWLSAPAVLGDMPKLLVVLIIPAALVLACSQTWQSWAAAEGAYRRLSILRIVQAASIISLQMAVGMMFPSAQSLVAAYVLGLLISLGTFYLLFPIKLPKSGQRLALIWAFWKMHRKFPFFSLPADSINIFAAQLPVLVIASRYGADIAGYLAMTIRLLGAPISLLGRSVLDVFKRYASVSFRNTGSCRAEYLRTLYTLSLGAVGFGLVLFFFAEPLFVLALGDEWRMSGKIALWLLPLFALRFVASPLSYTIYIAGKQHLDLAWQVVLLTMSVLCLTLPNTVETALKGYSYGYSALYLAYLYLSYRCSLGNLSGKRE